MIPSHHPNRIQIATAAEVAARIPANPNGKDYRTRGYCHDHADKPDSASLTFYDPEQPGHLLDVYCFKCRPRTPDECHAIRHALEKATGLQLCLCPACQQAHRTGRKPSTATTTAPPRQQAHTDRRQTAGLGSPPVAPRRYRHPFPQHSLPAMRAARHPDRMDPGRSPVPLYRPRPQVPVRAQLRPPAQTHRRQGLVMETGGPLHTCRRTQACPRAH